MCTDFYSMGEDAEMEAQIEAVARRTLPRKVWETREGVRIRMSDMNDKHLRNTIRFLRRRSDALMIRYLRNASKMLENMSENSQDAFAYEMDRAVDGTPHDQCVFSYDRYRALYEEAQKRWGDSTETLLTATVEQDK